MINDKIIDINHMFEKDNIINTSFSINIPMTDVINENYREKYDVDKYSNAIGKDKIYLIFRCFNKIYFGYWDIIGINIYVNMDINYFIKVQSTKNDFFSFLESEIDKVININVINTIDFIIETPIFETIRVTVLEDIENYDTIKSCYNNILAFNKIFKLNKYLFIGVWYISNIQLINNKFIVTYTNLSFIHMVEL